MYIYIYVHIVEFSYCCVYTCLQSSCFFATMYVACAVWHLQNFIHIDLSFCCFCQSGCLRGLGERELQWVMWCVITFLWGCFGSRVRCLHSVHVILRCFVCRPRMSPMYMYIYICVCVCMYIHIYSCIYLFIQILCVE